jgi:hypothetical protein
MIYFKLYFRQNEAKITNGFKGSSASLAVHLFGLARRTGTGGEFA